MDSYAEYVWYETLKYLKDSNIIVIGILSHTPHILQPRNVSVFSSFKCAVSREFRRLTRAKKLVDLFDMANMLEMSYQTSRTIKISEGGFQQSAICNFEQWGTTVSTLQDVVTVEVWSCATVIVWATHLLTRFQKISRTILAGPVIEVRDRGNLLINLAVGVHYTSEELEALKEKRKMKRAWKQALFDEVDPRPFHRGSLRKWSHKRLSCPVEAFGWADAQAAHSAS